MIRMIGMYSLKTGAERQLHIKEQHNRNEQYG